VLPHVASSKTTDEEIMRKLSHQSKKSFFNPANVLGFLCPPFRQQKIVLDNSLSA